MARSNLSSRLLQHIRTHGYVHPGDRVAVAVSGGADSVALLLLLLELRPKLGIVLSVAHFNHQLRGRISDADETFVAKLAARLKLPLHIVRSDIAAKAKRDKANLEDTARRARYAFFAKLVAENDATRVAVAHTADDQAETVLAHILRGTGLTGLGGIHPIAQHIVRPLIQVRRADLRAYLRSKKQPWREDATNRDTTKTRARVRKKLIPLLEKQFQPNVVEHLAALADLAREDESLLDAITKQRTLSIVEITRDTARVSIQNLSETISPALSKRVIRLILEKLKPRSGECGSHHIQAALNLAEHGQNGKSLTLPGGVEVRRDRDTLVFQSLPAAIRGTKQQPPASKTFEYPIKWTDTDALLPVPCLACAFRLTMIDWPAKRRETIDTRSVLDRQALRFPLVLRSWRPGDRYQPIGHRAAHKLKRLLNQRHISRWERNGWPVLTSGGVLAWARGFPVAAEFAASERTQVGILIAEEPLS